MTIDARVFNLGSELGTVDGWEYRRCDVVYRYSGESIELYCAAVDWDRTSTAIAARYEAEITALRAENEALRTQLKEREWQPLPAKVPTEDALRLQLETEGIGAQSVAQEGQPKAPTDMHCDQTGCEYVAKDNRDKGRHKWFAHGIRGASAQALLKVAKI